MVKGLNLSWHGLVVKETPCFSKIGDFDMFSTGWQARVVAIKTPLFCVFIYTAAYILSAPTSPPPNLVHANVGCEP